MAKKPKTITYRGEALTIRQWAERLNCHPNAIAYRLAAGWPTSTIITTPFRKRRKANG